MSDVVPRVAWHRGQVLLPEHFRALEDSLAGEAAALRGAAGLPDWGFVAFDWDAKVASRELPPTLAGARTSYTVLVTGGEPCERGCRVAFPMGRRNAQTAKFTGRRRALGAPSAAAGELAGDAARPRRRRSRGRQDRRARVPRSRAPRSRQGPSEPVRGPRRQGGRSLSARVDGSRDGDVIKARRWVGKALREDPANRGALDLLEGIDAKERDARALAACARASLTRPYRQIPASDR
jgi:hypothetical protein